MSLFSLVFFPLSLSLFTAIQNLTGTSREKEKQFNDLLLLDLGNIKLTLTDEDIIVSPTKRPEFGKRSTALARHTGTESSAAR